MGIKLAQFWNGKKLIMKRVKQGKDEGVSKAEMMEDVKCFTKGFKFYLVGSWISLERVKRQSYIIHFSFQAD